MLTSTQVDKMDLDERCLRGALRLGVPTGGPNWYEFTDAIDDLLWFLYHWPQNDVDSRKLYCGLYATLIANGMGTLTSTLRPGGMSDFDYLGTTLVL